MRFSPVDLLRTPADDHRSRGQLILNSFWMIAERVVGLGVGLIVVVVVARDLGVALFGELQFATSFVGLFALLAGLGLESILVQRIVASPERTGTLIGTAVAIRGVFGAILVLLVGLASSVVGNTQSVWWMVLLVALAILPQSFLVIELFFHARLRARISSVARISTVLVGAVIVVALVHNDAPAMMFAALPLIEASVLGALLLFLYINRGETGGKLRFDRLLARQLLVEGWPVALALGLVSVYSHMDRVMIGWLIGKEATGLYTAAIKLSEAWYFVPTAIINAVFPLLVLARGQSETRYYQRLQDVFDLMVWLAVAVAVPVTLWSSEILEVAYGHAYRQAGPVLSIHVWTAVLVFLGTASGRWMILEGMRRAYLARTAAGVMANFAGNLLLVPRVGIAGAAVSTLCAQFVVVLLFDACWAPTRRVFRMKCRSIVPLHRITFLVRPRCR